MSFTPINFDSNTLITPAKLRHIETQYEKGSADADDDIWIRTEHPLRVEVGSSAFITPVIGRILLDTFDSSLKVWDGEKWMTQI